MPGRKYKEFQEYLINGGKSHVDHGAYSDCPATAFLRYTVEAKSAVDLCSRYLKVNGAYNEAAQDTLEHLVAAFLPSVMGHFETFQRYLFAGVFDRSVHLEKFDVSDFLRKLQKITDCSIDLTRLAAHRGLGAKSIGVLLSDSMTGWHNPDIVNKFFDAFGMKAQFYSNDDIRRIKVLWQLRHSLVHTGGTITLADAQKIPELSGFGGKNIVFERQFILEVSRKLHPLVKGSVGRLRDRFVGGLRLGISDDDRREVEDFFTVTSTVGVWLRDPQPKKG